MVPLLRAIQILVSVACIDKIPHVKDNGDFYRCRAAAELSPIAVLLVMGTFALGCGGGEQFGCLSSIEGMCHQYDATDEGYLERAKQFCRDTGELADSCPTDDLVGCCVNGSETNTAYTCYYAPYHTAALVRGRCEDLGSDFAESF
jgi:hypothetical protein